MHYNLDYALRLCSQNGRVESCVHIYSNMGLYEEAVNLALKVGLRKVLPVSLGEKGDFLMLWAFLAMAAS